MTVQFETRNTLDLLAILTCAVILSRPLTAADTTAETLTGAAANAAIALPAAGRAPSGSLIGVTLAPGGFTLSAVNVVIRNLADSTRRQLVSDSDGTFAVEDLSPGTYQITASKDGLTTVSATMVEIASAKTANANVQLTQGVLGSLRCVAVAPDGFSLAGVNVAVHSVAGSLHRNLITGADGKLLARDLPPGTYQIMASKEGFTSPPPITVEVAQNRTSNANLLLAEAKPLQLPQATPVQVAQIPTPQAQSALPPKAVEPTSTAPAAAAVDTQTPFAFGDFTWLNGNARNKDTVVDTPFFTPEVRFDSYFAQSFNQPVDHTLGGSTELFRSGEFQVEQASVGGDFHWQNVRGRILFMQGMFASTTPRNDPSTGNGQWDLRNAYRYVSEAYGGYHFDINHGLNIDAGIFVSYIGLFSYYNFDNWTYQPSYVSSNTPWFFNGLRIQWFPTNKLKIEPWIINGWQSYAKANGHHGFGGQILYRPKEWLSLVFNNYGNGTDALGIPNRVRIHTDDSILVRYYNHPENTGLSQIAFSFTGDLGCEYGGGVTCHGGKGGPKQAFLGWMLYNRFWFHKNLFAITPGGGMMNNPGRYLTLLPPINGADAISGSPYFTGNPGDKAHMWDTTLNFQYMPKQYVTWWLEFGYRHSDIPYWSGRGGITPPGGNNGAPAQYACSNGAPSGATDLATSLANCGGPGNVWFPDLRHSQAVLGAGVLVKF